MDALKFLHESKKMIHCDLKPSNILVEELVNTETEKKCYIKLVDPGFAALHEKVEFRQSVPQYTAPEMLDYGNELSNKVDTWGLGAIAFFFYSGGCSPFDDEYDENNAEIVNA